MTRTQIINGLIAKNNYKSYLEIGINEPSPDTRRWNWTDVQIETKHGVDPNVDTTYRMTSDEFFAKHVPQKYDIIFVDGLHLFEQAHRDILNSLNNLNENGTIIVHDCNPIHEITQRRERVSAAWHGDVWKAILKLRIEEPFISIDTVDTDEGCGIIRKGTQELLNPIEISSSFDIYDYSYLEKHRQKFLNLISIENFVKKYL